MTANYFIGAPINDVDTPVLMVDLDILEDNIERSAAFFANLDVSWRPHTKGQKVPAIAHMEIDAGAIGITCAKLGEAEVMAASGIRNIMIANQIVGGNKVRRLANLCRQAEVIVAVDSEVNLRELSDAGLEKGLQIPVVVEVDVGMERCGVEPGMPTASLSLQAERLKGVKYMGIMGWEGHARRHKDPDERRAVCEEAMQSLVRSAEICRREGLTVEIVSCGGTGTHEFSSHQEGITEVQAGGIVFNDMYYSALGLNHPYALKVKSTVVSRPNSRRIITDAGKKAMSSDAAVPRPVGVAGVELIRFSAEHTVIMLEEPNDDLAIGEPLDWVVGYSDTTVALHDEMYGVRDGRVEVVWPILGRGKIR